MTAKPLPVPDRDSAPYWAGLAAGELRVQRCGRCGALRWPARAICDRCRSFEAEWIALSGRGAIVSWVRTHQRFHPACADELPSLTLLVALEEQDDIRIPAAPADPTMEPAIGAPVRAVFREVADGVTLLFWDAVSRSG